MLNTKWGSEHQGDHSESYNDCMLCQSTSLWFQLAYQLLRRTCHVSIPTSDTLNSLQNVSVIHGATVRLETWNSQSIVQTSTSVASLRVDTAISLDAQDAASPQTDVTSSIPSSKMDLLSVKSDAKSQVSVPSSDGGSTVSLLNLEFQQEELQEAITVVTQIKEAEVVLSNQPPTDSSHHPASQERLKSYAADDYGNGKTSEATKTDEYDRQTSTVSARERRRDYARTGVLRGKEMSSDMPMQLKLLIGCLSVCDL